MIEFPRLGEIVLQPAESPSRILAIGLAVAGIAAIACLRAAAVSRLTRRVLAVFRLAGVASLVAILLGPSAMRRVSEGNSRRKLVVAMDTSCSFGTEDVDGSSRFDAARRVWLDPTRFARLRERFDVRLYRYDEQLIPTDLPALKGMSRPAGRETYIASAVGRLLETEFAQAAEPAGILLIGDGHETGPGDPVAVGQTAARRGVPIWTSCFGGQRTARDAALQTFSGQEFFFARQTGQIAGKVLQTGLGMEEAVVELFREGQLVQEKRIAFAGRTACDVTFDVREDQPGSYEYEMRIRPFPNEADSTNNNRTIFVSVGNERIRVLLAEAQPHWDSRFLAQSLRADPRVELTQVVGYSPSRFHAIRRSLSPQGPAGSGADDAAPVPRTKRELFEYDVLIFGKGLPELLGPEGPRWIREFLEQRGGGVVFARGRPCDPTTPSGRAAAEQLAPLDPVVWGEEYIRDLTLTLTPAGRLHPSFQFPSSRPPDVIIRQLPEMTGAVRIRREKAAALVLARSEAGGSAPTAAVAYQNYGRGKVVSVLNEGLWRWAFLPEARGEMDRLAPFDVFWRRMVQWLVGSGEFLPGQDVALSIAQFPSDLGEPARIEVRLKYPPERQTPVSLTVSGPDGRTESLPLESAGAEYGLLWSNFEPKQAGVYRVALETPEMVPPRQETRFCVYDYSAEMIHTSADPVALRDMAEASGGRHVDPAEPDRLFEYLDELHPSPTAQKELAFLWDRGWVLATIVMLFGIEWFIRRCRGLL